MEAKRINEATQRRKFRNWAPEGKASQSSTYQHSAERLALILTRQQVCKLQWSCLEIKAFSREYDGNHNLA